MSNCKRCNFQDYMRETHGDWDNVHYYVENYPSKQFGDYVLVDSFFDPVPGEGRGYYGDNCHEQGHEGDVWMVFKDPDGLYFKVWGTSNSYGSCTWHGVKEVVGKVVEKVVYEFKEA